MAPRRAVVLVLAVMSLAGCLGRSLPIPPPTAAVQAVTDCPREQCPNGGVIVTVSGSAFPNATVIVEDTNPALAGERGELLAAVARAREDGEWSVTLFPLRDPVTMVVRAVRRGDVLSVWQITAGPDSEPSQLRSIQVPR